jgi:hypothetical protein
MADSYSTNDRAVAATFIAFDLMKTMVVPTAGDDPVENAKRRGEVFAAVYAKVRQAQIDGG